jgi:hypothetical protein
MHADIVLGQLDKNEALRYMGHRGEDIDEQLDKLITKCEKEVLSCVKPRFVYKVCDISREEKGILVKDTNLFLTGNSIKKHLDGCDKAVLMAVTISADADRLIRIAQIRDMAEAVAIDSLCSVAVEQACDRAELIIKEENPGYYQTFRFGLGYGDLPISLQGQFLHVLNAPKQIGLNVSSTDMLTPTKSVTAIIGISDTQEKCHIKGCEVCEKKDCIYRRN